MAERPLPSAASISAKDFNTYLAKYEDCIEAISASKGSKPGDKTLAELDRYRYGDAIADFSGENPPKQMGLEEVKTLVSWKLRHGKFRPTLMKLVSSNDADFVQETMNQAREAYGNNRGNVTAALKILTKLKGIGPATASLLLAVQDPEQVIFFADEAFYWLCRDGKKAQIKYDAKEYQELAEAALKLCKRLDVKAVDVEKVSFVIMRQQDVDAPIEKASKTTDISPPPTSRGNKAETEPEKGSKKGKTSSPSNNSIKKAEKKQLPSKRKAASGEEEAVTAQAAGQRRSKRIQGAKEA